MTYKLLTYLDASGPRAGVLVGARVHDVATSLRRSTYLSVRGILDDWANASVTIASAAASLSADDGLALADLELLPPIVYPGAIYCAGANYRDHVENMARRQNIAPQPDPHELGLSPWHFLKASWCAVGDGAAVELDCDFLDWEAELAVVIGRSARRVPAERVYDHVAGYTVANDLSARDRMKRQGVPIDSPFYYDWIGQKNFEGSCPLGPWIVPAGAIADPQALAIRTYVNDVAKQDSNTGRMIFTIAEQIAHLSSLVTLHPGDIVLTGTPAGVGAETGERLARGDVVRVEIEGIGRLVTRIV